MTRWGLVGVLVVAVACGGKKEGDKPAETAKGSGTAGAPPSQAVKRGGDDAACTKVVEKIEAIFEAENPDHAYAMLSEMKDGEAYQGIWRQCTRWWTAEDVACITAVADVEALAKCEGINPLAIDEKRDIPACAGGVVAQLSCPEGAYQDGRVCVPAPAGFTAEPSGGAVELIYADGSKVRVNVGDGSECVDSMARLVSGKYSSDELFDECQWPRGRFVSFDPRGDEPRFAKAQLCSGGSSITCSVKNAPKLEAACRAIQVVGPDEDVLELRRAGDKTASKEAAPAGKEPSGSADDAIARVCACKDLACVDQRRAELTKAQAQDPRVDECRRQLAQPAGDGKNPPTAEGMMGKKDSTKAEGKAAMDRSTLRISNIDPPSGPIEGGTHISIQGNYAIGATEPSAQVFFGPKKANVLRVADDEIIVEAPAGEMGLVDVLVVLDPGGELRLPGAFMYEDPMAGVE